METETETQTTIEPSEVTEVATQSEPETNLQDESNASSFQSGEDLNTQGEETISSSSNVVSDLSYDKLKEARKGGWDLNRDRYVQAEQQISQEAYSRGLDPIEQLKEFGTTADRIKTEKLEMDIMWDKATRAFPQLEKDPDLANLVYGNYKARSDAGESVTPLQVASEVDSYLSKVIKKTKSETYEQAENDISEKTTVSAKSPKRSTTGRAEVDIESLKRSVREGDLESMDKLLDLI